MIRRPRSLPATLLAISGLWVSLLLGASILWPVGYDLDEPAHVSMAYTYSVHPFRYYAPGSLHITSGVAAFEALETPQITDRSRLATAPIPARSSRPSLSQLGGSAPDPEAAPDQMVQHPPAYYYLEAILLRLPGVAGLGAGLVIWLMRLVSVALMAPVPLLCWDAGRRLLAGRPGADRAALLAAAVPLTIPDLIRDGAAVNNDTLLILATSFVLAMLTRVLRGDRSLPTAALVAVGVMVALWTKGFALMLPAVILLAYLGGHRDDQPMHMRRAPLLAPLAVVAAGCVAGSFWWVRNLFLYGTVQPNGFGAAYTRLVYGKPHPGGSIGPFLHPWFSGFIMRIWGEIGIPADLPSPGPIVVYGWFYLALVGLVIALAVPAGRRARVRSWVLALAIFALVAIDLYGSIGTWRTYHLVRANQGRYIYSSIVSIAALVAAGWARLAPLRVIRWAVPTVVTAAVVTNAWCWLLILRSDYQPDRHLSVVRGLLDALHALLRWSPTPDVLTLLVVVVLPVAAAAAAVTTSWRGARDLPSGQLHETGAVASVTR